MNKQEIERAESAFRHLERSTNATEARLRRCAKAAGLRLAKCRCRTPELPHYGTYGLIDSHTNAIIRADGPSGFGLNLIEVAAFLDKGGTP